jgi:hypothetical protein
MTSKSGGKVGPEYYGRTWTCGLSRGRFCLRGSPTFRSWMSAFSLSFLLAWFRPSCYVLSWNEIAATRTLFLGCSWNSRKVADRPICDSERRFRRCLQQWQKHWPRCITWNGASLKWTRRTNKKCKHTFLHGFITGSFGGSYMLSRKHLERHTNCLLSQILVR